MAFTETLKIKSIYTLRLVLDLFYNKVNYFIVTRYLLQQQKLSWIFLTKL